MRRFEAIVMSETEPINQGTLWLKTKENTMDPKGPKQFEIWYFGSKGWQPLADFDTRDSLTQNINYTESSKAVDITEEGSPEHGIVDRTLDFYIYNGSRTLGNNANLVNEAALKQHVDELQGQITTLNNQVSTLQGLVASHSTTISQLNSRLTALENA